MFDAINKSLHLGIISQSWTFKSPVSKLECQTNTYQTLLNPLIKVNGHGSTHVRVWDYRTKARPSYSTAATHIPRSCMSRLDMYEWVSNQVTISDLFYDSAFLTSVSLWLLEDVLLTVDFWDNEDTWDTRHCRLLIWPGPDSGAGAGSLHTGRDVGDLNAVFLTDFIFPMTYLQGKLAQTQAGGFVWDDYVILTSQLPGPAQTRSWCRKLSDNLTSQPVTFLFEN